MNDLLKNPLTLFIAMLLALWLFAKLLKMALSLWGLIVIALIVAFVVSPSFRASVRGFFNGIFNN